MIIQKWKKQISFQHQQSKFAWSWVQFNIVFNSYFVIVLSIQQLLVLWPHECWSSLPSSSSLSVFKCKTCVCPAGYRVRLGSSTDKKDTGRLHVDFAQARDDLYEWECRQRMLAREERHRRKMEEDRLRPPSPPPIVHYSEHECSQLGDKIKGWQTATTKTLMWRCYTRASAY